MREQGLPMTFEKDSSEIVKYLRKKHIRTAHNIDIKVPDEAQELVDVGGNRIIIRDSPESVTGNAS
jgi:hypothetical protein